MFSCLYVDFTKVCTLFASAFHCIAYVNTLKCLCSPMSCMTGVDCHAHLTHINDASAINQSQRTLTAVISVTAEIDHARQSLLFSKLHKGFVFTSLGLHPEYAVKYSAQEIDDYITFIKEHKAHIVAIGEIGLDYNWVTEAHDREKAKEVFITMIELAKRLNLPVQIHARNGLKTTAFSDCLRILADHDAKQVMMHCFSGSDEELRQAIALGYYISFATIICKSTKHQRLAQATPLDRMLLETDAPWLDPYSRELTNRPWKIVESANLIARLIETTPDAVLAATEHNAIRLFGLTVDPSS